MRSSSPSKNKQRNTHKDSISKVLSVSKIVDSEVPKGDTSKNAVTVVLTSVL